MFRLVCAALLFKTRVNQVMLGRSSLCILVKKKKKKEKKEKKKVNSKETIISVDRTRGNIGKYIGKFLI